VTEAYLQKLAQQVPGLNLASWTAARSNSALASSIASDAQAANSAGFTGTPAFLLGKTGQPLQKFEPGSFTDPAPYTAAVEKLLHG
jgi:protein-disulfide isomerase